MAELHHECGVAAIYHLDSPTPSPLAPAGGADNISRLMPRILVDLQNRGQLAAGFTTYNPHREQVLDTYKQIGTVIEAFRLNHQAKYDSIMKEYAGRAAIGHTRYATCGPNDRGSAQPFERHHGCKWKWFSIAFNGQLANFTDLRDELLTLADYHLTRNTDIGFKEEQSLDPGEMIVIQDGRMRKERFADNQQTSHCFFEWIYFANVASTLDERSVYLSRAALGKELAMQEHRLGKVPLDDDTIVVPVPDTGKAAADAMAYELGIPSVEGLMRNRYVGRTFIEGTNRADRVRMKYTPLRDVLQGKRVLLIEDTIVRSTTLKALLHHLRDRGGAKEVHVRVACPPIIAPCFYGIDMSTIDELWAPKFMNGPRLTDEEQNAMAKELGAESLYYLPLEAIAKCIGMPEDRLCRACLTGQYPTPTGEKLYQVAMINRNG